MQVISKKGKFCTLLTHSMHLHFVFANISNLITSYRASPTGLAHYPLSPEFNNPVISKIFNSVLNVAFDLLACDN